MADDLREQVSAAELVRAFPKYREVALRQPLLITNHGRPTHVLMAIDEYSARPAFGDDASDEGGMSDLVDELVQWSDHPFIATDGELRITHLNPATKSQARRPVGEWKGKDIFEVFPEFRRTMVETHLRRTAATGELGIVDIMSPFVEGGWLRMKTRPLNRFNMLSLIDITNEVHHHRLADVKESILSAMSAHHDIGYLRISLRGLIDRAEAGFCAMVGLPADRLIGLQVANLFGKSERPKMREEIEQVLSGGAARSVESLILTNSGTEVLVKAGMASLQGAYGAEGAILLFTNRNA